MEKRSCSGVFRGEFRHVGSVLGGTPSASPLMETRLMKAASGSRPTAAPGVRVDESGRYEVRRAVSITAVKTRVSKAGGSLPRWSRDGRELFFISADRHMMSVPISPGSSIVLGSPAPLFEIPECSMKSP
jgi:hypothetical protein